MLVMLPPRAEVILMRAELVALQYAAEVAQEVVKVVVLLFGLNVEISVPIISPGCGFDAIELKLGGDLVRVTGHFVLEFGVDQSRKSAVSGIYKVVPPNLWKDDIAGDNDLIAIPNAIIVCSLLVAK